MAFCAESLKPPLVPRLLRKERWMTPEGYLSPPLPYLISDPALCPRTPPAHNEISFFRPSALGVHPCFSSEDLATFPLPGNLLEMKSQVPPRTD